MLESGGSTLGLSPRHLHGSFDLHSPSTENLQHEEVVQSKWMVIAQRIKVTILTGLCCLCVVLFTIVMEHSDYMYHVSVDPNNSLAFPLAILESHKLPTSVIVELEGPFLPQPFTNYTPYHLNATIIRKCHHLKKNLTSSYILSEVLKAQAKATESQTWRDLQDDGQAVTIRDHWTIPLPMDLHHTPITVAPHYYKTTLFNPDCHEFLVFETGLDYSVPIAIGFSSFPERKTESVVYAALVLVGMYILITFELIHRTMAALLASTVALAVLAALDARPSMEEIVSWLDIETLCLLFGMMVMVSVLSESGFFGWVAVYTYEVTKGDPWSVITYLSVMTGVISAFLDNVTTVLLMTPITIRLAEVMGMDPVQILIITVIFSNLGGAATAIGDPPNVLIVSNEAMKERGIHFGNFTLHMSIGSTIAFVAVYFIFRWRYADLRALNYGQESADTAALRQEVATWKRIAGSFSVYSRQELVARKMLSRKIRNMESELKKLEKGHRKEKVQRNTETTLAELKEKFGIRNKVLLIKSLVVLAVVVLLFFLHTIPSLHLSLGWTSLLGALAILIIADVHDVELILARVEWPTLLFFAALFILMKALDKLGLLEVLGSVVESGIANVSPDYRLFVAMMLILWMSAIASAVIDNIPFTTMMIQIVIRVAENEELGLPLMPLVWALAFGACFGGNGTLIGASANLVCAGVAGQHGHQVTFVKFSKIGFPVMLVSVVIASFYLILCHVIIGWNDM